MVDPAGALGPGADGTDGAGIPSGKSKVWAVAEVTLFLTALMVAAHLGVPIVRRSCGVIAARLFIGFVWIVPPIAYVVLLKKDRAAYGFDFARTWRAAVYCGFWGFAVMILQAPGFVLWGLWGKPGMLILMALVVASTVLLLRVLRAEVAAPRVDWRIAVWIVLLVLPSVVALSRGRMSAGIVGWQAYFLFVVGFGEEVRSRGYAQSRLNEAFGRPWQIWGTRFGPGLLIASVLFGLSPIYQLGAHGPNVLLGIGATLGGLFYGIVRERAGTFLASALVHGLNTAAFEIYREIFKM